MSKLTSESHGVSSEEMQELGEALRSLREAQELSHDDVTAAIHVRPFVLRAMEEGRVLEVVDPVYARGFIKSYCEFLCAADLWAKYKDILGGAAGEVRLRSDDEPEAFGINHPTPSFRRSSMIWVYLVLIVAIGCAAYLLYSQQREDGGGFSGLFRRSSPPGQGVDGAARSDDAAISRDISQGNNSATVLSQATVEGQQQRAVAPPPEPMDLSWMDPGLSPDARARVRSVEPNPASRSNKLDIEIVGQATRLEVKAGGRVLTTRLLQRGGTRSYEITGDTTVSFANGSSGKVFWRGRTYNPIGNDNSPLLLLFTTNGEMRTLRGTLYSPQ